MPNINSVLNGSSGLTKLGNGTLVLGGSNGFTGAININADTLSVSSAGNLVIGSTAALTIDNGAKLAITDSFSTGRVIGTGTGGTPSYNFATHGGAATSISAYTGYTANNLATSAATDNVRLTASGSFPLSRTINSLTSSGTGITANAAGLQTLTLTSGNVLVQSGDLTIGSNLVVVPAATGNEIGLNVAPGATLNVNGTFSNAFNLTVALGGTVNLNSKQYFNTAANYLTINSGTVKLNAGNNTLFPGQTTGANQLLAIGPAGTLDLNGAVQVAGDLRSTNNNAFFGSGGIVTSTGGAATIVSRQANANWGGQITGPVTFVMGNTTLANVERFYQDNTYAGRTLIAGGTLELTDFGRLSGTSAIDVNQGVLNIYNTSANNGRANLTDRVPDATPINLSGGALFLAGRAQSGTTETLGAVTLVRGNSNLNMSAGGTGVNTTDFTITNIVQGSIDATTNVQLAGGQVGSGTRLFFGNGTALMSNNILPVWIESAAASS